MKKVLFLDIDGVLHPENGDPDMQFCYMTNFCEAVQSTALNTNLSIVISSMWRLTVPLEEIKPNFP